MFHVNPLSSMRIHMKYEVLFSSKDNGKKKKMKVSSAVIQD